MAIDFDDNYKEIVDSQSQTDPKFKTNRLYTRMSVAEVRRQLIAEKGYSTEELPSEETIRTRLNQLSGRLVAYNADRISLIALKPC